MRILVLGSNAGSDFICQQLLKESNVEKVYHYDGYEIAEPTERYVPLTYLGNLAHNIPTNIFEFLDTVDVDLIIPVIHHYQLLHKLRAKIKEKNIPTLMPSATNAMLEWSKITGKKLLNQLGIPTPNYQIMKKDVLLAEFFNIPRPFVLKYEQDYRYGLQTIIVNNDNHEEYYQYLLSMEGTKRFTTDIHGEFVDLHFIIEEFVVGTREISYHALCNSQGWRYIGSARDYKKRYEGDIGINTAGMGAYSPVNNVDTCISEYVDKILNHLRDTGDPYIGFLYLGIMIVNDVPYVLEINTRAGDPEIQPIIRTIKNNLADLFFAAASDKIIPEIEFSDNTAVSIRIVNEIYDTSIQQKKTGFKSPDLWPLPGNIQMAISYNRRLLNCILTSEGNTIEEASNILYKFLENKPMYKFTYRKDIGYLK
jgi:phosphoribosylamine---glycine ligase